MGRSIRRDTVETIIEETGSGKGIYEYDLEENARLTAVLVVSRETDADIIIHVRLLGRGAQANVIALVRGSGDNHISLHTKQLHEAPETTSNLLVKSALRDNAKFAYDGVIRVEPVAQKTDAYQKNENLFLSGGPQAQSDPALEILANDVRCTHGSTTGKLSEDHFWYLASRGISRPAAMQLLVEGFFEYVISTISDTISREKIRRALWRVT